MSSFLKYMELLVFKISTSATYFDDTKLFIISEEKKINNFFPGYHNVLKHQYSILSFVMNLTENKTNKSKSYLTFVSREKLHPPPTHTIYK